MGITRGNGKLGENIWGWSLPAKVTCPVISEVCNKVCYAMRGRYHSLSVQDALKRNLEIARSRNFARWMNGEIQLHQIRVVRIHVSGDFFSRRYIEQWDRVIEQNPDTRFFAFTRVWAKTRLLPSLAQLARHRNLQLWWSVDHSMPRPPRVPHVKIGWLALSDEDVPPYPVDLVFRNASQTHRVRLGGAPVCAYEVRPGFRTKHTHKITCTSCGRCYPVATERARRLA